MSAPTEPPEGSPDRPVDLGKQGSSSVDPNDPYRFGLPERLPPPEYAPPGWTPPGGWPSAAPHPGLPDQQAGYQPPPSYPPYPPYPHGYGPPPPQWSPYQAPRPGRGKAIAALVLGLLSILFFEMAFFDAVFVIAAVAFGAVALTERSAGPNNPRGMAIAGLVCAGIGAVLAIVWTVFLFHAISQCGGVGNSGQPGFKTCLQQHF